jgi:hypothetical protein
MVHPVPFLVVALGPDVDPFTLHLLAALAEKGPWPQGDIPHRSRVLNLNEVRL